jgi:hypothetical protein
MISCFQSAVATCTDQNFGFRGTDGLQIEKDTGDLKKNKRMKQRISQWAARRVYRPMVPGGGPLLGCHVQRTVFRK